jgi:NADP-dependent 3-hydroxy acid dehydrogenase YdfG
VKARVAIRQRLQQEGAKVVIVGRDAATLAAAGREFGFISIWADVGRLSEIDRMYQEISGTVGNIDLLFANAGIYQAMPLADTTEAFFDATVGAELTIDGGLGQI